MSKGVFVNYRGGRRTQNNHQILIRIEEITNRKEAARFIGKQVVWKNPKGTSLVGKVVGVHGRRGVLKARFTKSLPGQAVGAELIIR